MLNIFKKDKEVVVPVKGASFEVKADGNVENLIGLVEQMQNQMIAMNSRINELETEVAELKGLRA